MDDHGSERVELISAGIDIGSATCQLAFSRLVLVRAGRALSSRYHVRARETIYAAPQVFTPYDPAGMIDADGVRRFVADGFSQSGLTADQVDTGVILLTGEAARRRNAEELATTLAMEVGSFVCAAAGHSMEGTLAAHGSGAVAWAQETGRTVLNVDIGGGTTKVTLVRPAGVDWTFAVHAGGRLAAFDPAGTITRLERQGAALALQAGVDWRIGRAATEQEVARVGEHLADVVWGFLPGAPRERRALVGQHLLTPFPGYTCEVDDLVISGGVAVFVAEDLAPWSEDLGARFGHALWKRLQQATPAPRVRRAGGDATVLGAAEHTVQVSGNTIHLSPGVRLPLRNLRVVKPMLDLSGAIETVEVVRAIHAEASNLHDAMASGGFALAWRWQGSPEYRRIASLARGLTAAIDGYLAAGEPLCLLFDGDVARLVGKLIDEALAGHRPVITVDGIDVAPFDFVDVGAVLQPSGTVPITIKSLLFH